MELNQDNIISIKNLHKFFGDNHILKGIDFEAKQGELVSIIGRSGCGKTTFLRCLNCLELLDQGTMIIAGINIARNSDDNSNKSSNNKYLNKKSQDLRKKVAMPFLAYNKELELDDDFRMKTHTLRTRVGMLFQMLNLFPNMTVLENIIKAPCIVKKVSQQQAIDNAVHILEKVGLSRFISRYPHELSGGQAQRVAIARALAMSPQIMLYDEPTSALDPELIEEIIEVMKNLHIEGMTQIVVTHAMNFAKYASDRVIYMEDGQFIEEANPIELFSNPKNEKTKRYLNLFLD